MAWSLRAGPGNGDGGGTWADNATAERREAGLLVAREVLLPRKRGVARYCATRTRLDVSGRSANSPRSGVGSDEGEKRKEKNPDIKRAGTEETGLFDMVNRKDASGAQRQTLRSVASRQRQRARVPAERAPPRAFSQLRRSVSACAKRNESHARRCASLSATNPFARMTLGRAALAPQLSDRPVCEPPQVPLAVLSQSREASG